VLRWRQLAALFVFVRVITIRPNPELAPIAEGAMEILLVLALPVARPGLLTRIAGAMIYATALLIVTI